MDTVLLVCAEDVECFLLAADDNIDPQSTEEGSATSSVLAKLELSKLPLSRLLPFSAVSVGLA